MADHFDELAFGLNWGPGETLVFMLWAYFDESGLHATRENGGRLVRLSLVGCVSTTDKWRDFNAAWGEIIRSGNVEHFHAKEFWAKKQPHDSPYRNWSEGKRDSFIFALSSCMRDHVPINFGATYDAVDSDKAVEDTWRKCAEHVIKKLSRKAELLGEAVSVVFAKHPEIEDDRITNYCAGMVTALPSLTGGFVRYPNDLPPLQAADLLAYEVSHD